MTSIIKGQINFELTPDIMDGTSFIDNPVGTENELIGVSNTDLVVESGSNANGRWTKFASGIVYIYNRVETTINNLTFISTGNDLFQTLATIPLPIELYNNQFSGTAHVTIRTAAPWAYIVAEYVPQGQQSPKYNSIRMRIIDVSPALNGDLFNYHYCVVGRWK